MKGLTFYFILFYSFCFSQETINLTEVSYTFDVNLSNYTEGIPYKSRLYYNDSTSLFIYNRINFEGTEKFFKKVGDRKGRVNGIHLLRNYDEEGYKFHLNFNTKELTSREVLMEKYEVTVKEKNIEFNWVITEESKKIGEYVCYKATTQNFRGRNYEVWFTYDIPVPTGPWKFHGLPGLILEVHDDKNIINITFNNIKQNNKTKAYYAIPTSKEVYNLKEYLKERFRLYLAYVNNKKAMTATGQMRNSDPIAYVNIEYNEEQIKLLDKYQQIEYHIYEESLKKD
ncbi:MULTISPECIES: GLPGLI family protein [Winogradskyella]|uniref:GLPGLI family protein n=1 Tax=Winogradskyella TaxID=286104 RepID=UPI0015C96763|nr:MULTISPECIES: GLPGLI family protein [Winogradskyella]QXP78924.1 GLPGLI family protein [Winogradskyella sp. HaHa_3_26]